MTQFKREYKVWSYTQMGRTFVIDPNLPGDSNILKAVCEVILPGGEPKKDPNQSPLDYKHHLCQLKEVFAEQIVYAMRVVPDYDEGDLEHG